VGTQIVANLEVGSQPRNGYLIPDRSKSFKTARHLSVRFCICTTHQAV